MSKLVLKITFLAFGAGLFIWALQSVDLNTVGSLLLKMGLGFLWVMGIYSVVTWVDTISWKQAFTGKESRHITVFDLWRVRQIGESFNTITPFGTVGGEPVKAQLLKDHYGLSFKQGLSSQVVARTTFLTALIAFMIPGVFVLWNFDQAAADFKIISVSLLATFSTAIFFFLLFQIKGSLGKISGWWKKRFPTFADSEFLGHLEELDRLMSTYYREHPWRFIRSVGYALAGWWVGLLELYATLYFLGHPVSFQELWIIEAVSQLIRVCSFFIPLSLGAQEGGLVLIFVSLKMSGDLGLAVSFVRRIKELLWVGMGLLLAGGMAFKPSQVQTEKAEP